VSLNDLIESDAVTVFCNTSDFAEAVTYWARGSATGRSIDAVVAREQIVGFDADNNQVNLAAWQVHVANDSTDGISGTELNLGGDQIAFPPRDGQAAVRKSITQVLIQDHGMLVLECR
tara:strand:+ start:793 stop:1146 length:354 start_codon:yes stop_codon:yes gene_type:complete